MRRYGILVVALVAAFICVRFGVWQLRRLEERRTVNAERAERLAIGPLELRDQRAFDPSLAFRRAVVEGEFDFARQIVVVARSFRGVPGVHLVTPLALTDGSSILVERGWVPSPDGRTVDLERYLEAERARVDGVLLEGGPPVGAALTSDSAWPRYVRRPVPAAVHQAYPYPLAALVLRRTREPDSVPPGLRPVPLPALSDGPHLSYAIQWFAFATIAMVGSVVLVVKSRARGERGRPV